MLRVHGEESRDTLDTIGNLAMLYDFEDKFAQSEAFYVKAADGLRRLEGKEDHDTLLMTEGLAGAYDHEYKYAQADALYSEVLETESRVLGKDHPHHSDDYDRYGGGLPAPGHEQTGGGAPGSGAGRETA